MNSDDQARLRVAYAAWRGAAPSEEEVSAGAQRVLRALRTGPVRRRSLKTMVIMVSGVMLGSAAVYAAVGGPLPAFLGGSATRDDAEPAGANAKTPSSWGPSQPRDPDSVGQDSTRQDEAPQNRAPQNRAPQNRAQSAPDAGKEPSAGSPQSALPSGPARRTRPSPSASSASSNAASWHSVDEALAQGDTAAAQAALEILNSRANDDNDRAKSRLGLAQLALARGDCKRAQQLAQEMLALSNAHPRYRKRASAIAARCSHEAQP